MVKPRQGFLGTITVLDEDLSGEVDCSGARLINISDPVDGYDLATKNYVDNEISNISGSSTLNIIETTASAEEDEFSPVGWDSADIVKINAQSGGSIIYGLAQVSGSGKKKKRLICLPGTNEFITIKHENSNAGSTQRIRTSGSADVVLLGTSNSIDYYDSVDLYYDDVLQRWVTLGVGRNVEAGFTLRGNLDLNNNDITNVGNLSFYSETVITDPGSGTININYNAANSFQYASLTLSRSPTLSFSFSGVGYYQLKIAQDATGDRSITWPAEFRAGNGSKISIAKTANSITLITIYYDGTLAWAKSETDFTSSVTTLLVDSTNESTIAASIGSNTTNWNPTGWDNADTVRISQTGTYSITGMAAPTSYGKKTKKIYMPGGGGDISIAPSTTSGYKVVLPKNLDLTTPNFIFESNRGIWAEFTYNSYSGEEGWYLTGTNKFIDIGGNLQGPIKANNNDIRGIKTISFNSEYSNGLSGSSIAINFQNGQNQSLTLNQSTVTITSFTFPSPGIGTYTLRLIQDATGGRTVVWPSTARGSGNNLNVTSAANGVTIVSIFNNGTNTYLSSLTGLSTSGSSPTTVLV